MNELENLHYENNILTREVSEQRETISQLREYAQGLEKHITELNAYTASLQKYGDDTKLYASTIKTQNQNLETNLQIEKNRNSELQRKLENSENLLSTLEKYRSIIDIDETLKLRQKQRDDLETKCEKLRTSISFFIDEHHTVAHGLYKPIFNFDDTEMYKEQIQNVRARQKRAIKENNAVYIDPTYKSRFRGTPEMAEKVKRLLILAFNSECENLIKRVKWNNIRTYIGRIELIFQSINSTYEEQDTYIKESYKDLKLEEICLTHEYHVKRHQQKEAARLDKERVRDEIRAQQQYQEKRLKVEAQEQACKANLEKAKHDLSSTQAENKCELQKKIEELEHQLKIIQNEKQRAISMAQQTRSGYVYIISNIGSFGEGVYKIGMTRRLDPLHRIQELGDASVPFRFDIHALIYSKDAPSLEARLHARLNTHRLNLVNLRREFFKVDLETIKEALIKENEATEITHHASSEEWRETNAIKHRDLQR